MKRFIRVVALCMVFALTFSPAASASENLNDTWFNVLDYATPNNNDGYNVTVEPNGSVNFSFDFPVTVHAIDFTISTVNVPPSAVYFEIGSLSFPLNIVEVGDSCYRIYGSGIGGYFVSSFNIRFASSNNIYCSFLSCRLSSLKSFHESDITHFTVTYDGDTYSATMPDVRSPATIHLPSTGSTAYPVFYDYSSYIYLDNWLKYDYVDVSFAVKSNSLESISVFCKDYLIPYSLSYVSMSDNDVIKDEGNYRYSDDYLIEEFTFITPSSYVYVTMRIDLTGLDRSSGYQPVIYIRGQYGTEGGYLALREYSGGILAQSLDPVTYQFRLLKNHLSALFSTLQARQDAYHSDLQSWQQEHDQILIDKFSLMAERLSGIRSDIVTMMNTLKSSIDTAGNNIVSKLNVISSQLDQLLHPDTSDSEKFEDDIASQATEMEDISETLDSVTKPAVDDLDPSVDDIVSPADIENYTSILGILLGNNIFLSVCLMSLTLALLSYTLYGKR